MKRARIIACMVVVLALLLAMGCSKRQVTRIDTDSVTDLSGRWNDTDSRLVSQEMIADCLASPWKSAHWEKSGKKPAIIVGVIRNKSSEHIAVETFIGDMERAFINTAEVTVVAGGDEREQVREERADQQTYASEETVNRWGRELGADYMMTGTISSISDQEGREKVIFYQIDLRLIDLENNTKIWLGQKKIKKYIGYAKVAP